MFFYSCKEEMSDSDRKAAREGTKSQEIKKIDEAEIVSAGLEIGRSIADITQKTLGSTLKSHIQNDGIEPALKYCNLTAYPLVDSLSKVYSAKIKRVSMKLRNPDNKPDDIETELLDAYQYSLDESQQVADNIQDLDNGYLLYTKPILIGDPVCLQCHGKIGEEVVEETGALLKELYPMDKATGYSITEMRGMWSIHLDKKYIVNSL